MKSKSSCSNQTLRVKMLRWAVLITSVCGVVDARRASTFYHETKNNNITITWDSQIRTNMSRTNLICVFQSVVNKVIFRIRNGVEVPESLHEQFVRRVQCDKDALREGQIKLNLSTVTTDDAGNYWCKLTTAFGKTMANETFVLNITTVKTRPEIHKGAKHLRRGPKLGSRDGRGWEVAIFSFLLPIFIVAVAYPRWRWWNLNEGQEKK
ncbi:uncharacterized protein LOC127363556 isoform X7 [Dicentrarchus labrax]|uniref:uncharacterized protein LOC127363556 isoform X7 n=1 Tax=Dicentrarchus labrax TaxID=13489 RepID=UPI0021F67BA2|nr:uncharacterized protein LOC127363556 isoform X7 [Dicentrarchus labrax]